MVQAPGHAQKMFMDIKLYKHSLKIVGDAKSSPGAHPESVIAWGPFTIYLTTKVRLKRPYTNTNGKSVNVV